MNDEHKSEKIKQIAIQNGWKCQVVPRFDVFDTTGDVSDIIWDLYALRGKETISVSWHGNRLESGLYVYKDYRRTLWWKTEVVKFLGQDPKDAGPIPWEEDAPAFDILLAVVNRKIKWVRKLDGQECEALVDVNLSEPGSAKHFRIHSTKSGRRVLEWTDSLGFHAVGLDQIIEVS